MRGGIPEASSPSPTRPGRLVRLLAIASALASLGCSVDEKSLGVVQKEIRALTSIARSNPLLNAPDVAAVDSFGESVEQHVDDLLHGRKLRVVGKGLP